MGCIAFFSYFLTHCSTFKSLFEGLGTDPLLCFPFLCRFIPSPLCHTVVWLCYIFPSTGQSLERMKQKELSNRYPTVEIVQSSILIMDSRATKERKSSISQHSEFAKTLIYDYTGGIEIVKAGTLPALVEYLTRHDKLDAAFNRTFLTTYKYFLSTKELIRHLINRFENKPPDLDPSDFTEWSENIRPLVRLRVINIFKQWLESFWVDSSRCDATTSQDLLEIKSFVYRINDASEAVAARQLLSIIQCRLEGVTNIKTFQPSLSNSPKPILPKKLSKLQFMKIDAKEIARQLTIMESSMFSKIQPRELLNKSWSKKDNSGGPGPAPHIRASIRYSNQVSNWVVALILAEPELKKRTQVIGHLVNVASVC